jgi:CPA1 family monovalent cation:H+ antiporter
MAAFQSGLAFVVVLLGVALALGALAERLRIPYPVMLLAASAPFAVPGLPIQFGAPVLAAFLPALIFEAAWNLNHEELRRTWRAVAFLAFPGVVFSAAFVGTGLFFMGQLPLPQALILGVILAATDPVAVTSAFRSVNAPLRLTTVVEGESLFNDGMTLVAYGCVVGLAFAPISSETIGSAVAKAIGALLGGGAIGAVFSLPIARLMREVVDPLLRIAATLVAAYGSYLFAESLHCSGIFATIVVGVMLRGLAERMPNVKAASEIEPFWSVLAFIANSLLFLLIGLRLEFPRMLHQPALVLGTLFLLIAARFALVYGMWPLLRIPDQRPAWRHVVMLAGMRGAFSLALALSLPAELPMRPQIVDAVFAAVFATLIVQGIAIGPLASRLRL